MPLLEHFDKSGKWLFRWRSYLPLFFLAAVLFAMREYHYPGHSHMSDYKWEAFCLFVSFLGFAVRAHVVGHTPRGTSGRNTKKQVADTLNTTGLYSVVRNPLYLGNFLMGLGVALFAFLWWLPVMYALAFWLYYERIIFAEETYLREKFGQEYMQWAGSTPAFVPAFKKMQRPAMSFSLRNVLRREYNGLFGVVAAFFLLEVIGDYVVEGHLVLDTLWAGVFLFFLLVWLILRFMKKHTKWLNVEGRY